MSDAGSGSARMVCARLRLQTSTPAHIPNLHLATPSEVGYLLLVTLPWVRKV